MRARRGPCRRRTRSRPAPDGAARAFGRPILPVKPAIVTCGGLCPGLNTVIRELVMCLHYNYGVDTIYGVEGGYRGFKRPLKELVPRDVVVRCG